MWCSTYIHESTELKLLAGHTHLTFLDNRINIFIIVVSVVLGVNVHMDGRLHDAALGRWRTAVAWFVITVLIYWVRAWINQKLRLYCFESRALKVGTLLWASARRQIPSWQVGDRLLTKFRNTNSKIENYRMILFRKLAPQRQKAVAFVTLHLVGDGQSASIESVDEW